MKLKVAGYRRVSTEDQAESGHSLDAQQRAIEEFVRQRGWELVKVYTDAGLSGQLEQRPALTQLLQDAAAGKFDVVVVHAIDRFYRSLTGLLKAIEELRRHNVSFVSLSENLDFTSPWGKLALVVLGTLAEIYIDKLSTETKKGKLERARKGYWNGSIPFGLCNGLCSTCTDPNGPGYCPRVGQPDRSDGEHLIAHPIESVGLRRAFKLSATGHYTDRDIADNLNQQPVRFNGRNYTLRPKRRQGDNRRFGEPVFQKDTVREMLQRIFYTGLVPYYSVKSDGQKRKRQDTIGLYPGRHPVLIPQSLFEQVQQARQLRFPTRIPPIKTKRQFVYPLSGLLFCGGCGKPMRASSNREGRRYYRCPTRIQQSGQCDQPTVYAEEIEQQLVDYLTGMTLPDDWPYQLNQSLINTHERKGEFLAAQEGLVRVKELYLEGELSRAEYEQRRLVYRARLADLTDVPLEDMIAIGHLFQHFQEIWNKPDDIAIKRKLLRSLLGAVTIRGNALQACEPNSAFYLLLRHLTSDACHCGSSCLSGSDGKPLLSKYNVEFFPPATAAAALDALQAR